MKTNPFDPIDECQPWPDRKQSAAQLLHDTIEEGATRLRDQTADLIGEVAWQAAKAMAAELFRGRDHDCSPEWEEGAGYALARILSLVAASMTTDELQHLVAAAVGEEGPAIDEAEIEAKMADYDRYCAGIPRSVVLKDNTTITNDPCGICGQPTNPCGVDFMLEGSNSLVCDECAKKNNPAFFRQVDAWKRSELF